MHQESKIALYEAHYNQHPKAVVFVYPSKCGLDSNRIPVLFPEYTSIDGPLIDKEFKDLSAEEVSRLFFERVRPLMSNFDFTYIADRLQVKAHLFDPRAAKFIKREISDL